MSQFDPNAHSFRLLIIRCGKLLDPEEKNITKLYEKTRPKLGTAPFYTTTQQINYDAMSQLVRLIVLAAGEKLREARGQDAEPDLDKLYDVTAAELGLPEIVKGVPEDVWTPPQEGVKQLPAPHEMTNEKGEFLIPRKDCPMCKREKSMTLGPLCQSCSDAEGGKYKTMWYCGEMLRDRSLKPGTGCGYKDRSTKFFSQILTELGIDYKGGLKKNLGVKTYTDEGAK